MEIPALFQTPPHPKTDNFMDGAKTLHLQPLVGVHTGEPVAVAWGVLCEEEEGEWVF